MSLIFFSKKILMYLTNLLGMLIQFVNRFVLHLLDSLLRATSHADEFRSLIDHVFIWAAAFALHERLGFVPVCCLWETSREKGRLLADFSLVDFLDLDFELVITRSILDQRRVEGARGRHFEQTTGRHCRINHGQHHIGSRAALF